MDVDVEGRANLGPILLKVGLATAAGPVLDIGPAKAGRGSIKLAGI